MDRFVGKSAVVTGAASGLGRATAERLAAEGARVTCLDVQADAVAATAAAIEAAGGTAWSAVCDVSDPASVAAAMDEVAARGPLHVVCNVAGIGTFAHTVSMPVAQWQRIIGVNLTGTFLVCQAALPHLFATSGSIVNVASNSALTALPYGAAYGASKAGVVMFSKSLAAELLGRVRVNVVAPGGMTTSMDFPMPEGMPPEAIIRFGSPLGMIPPEQVAAAIAFVASDEAPFMTGAVVPVDAGTTV